MTFRFRMSLMRQYTSLSFELFATLRANIYLLLLWFTSLIHLLFFHLHTKRCLLRCIISGYVNEFFVFCFNPTSPVPRLQVHLHPPVGLCESLDFDHQRTGECRVAAGLSHLLQWDAPGWDCIPLQVEVSSHAVILVTKTPGPGQTQQGIIFVVAAVGTRYCAVCAEVHHKSGTDCLRSAQIECMGRPHVILYLLKCYTQAV